MSKKKTNSKSSSPAARPTPNHVELQPDHAKVLRDASEEEKKAHLQYAVHARRLREMEKSYEKQRADLLRLLDALDKRIKDQNTKIMEIAKSLQDFYELSTRPGFHWELNMDEAVWLRVADK